MAGEEVWRYDMVIYLQAITRPGAKLTHAWLVESEGKQISTLDVVGKGRFTLVGLSEQAWAQAARALNLPFLRIVAIGEMAAPPYRIALCINDCVNSGHASGGGPHVRS